MSIKNHKAKARSNANANGTSYQSELNAIALAYGYTNWGAFQKASMASSSAALYLDPAGTDLSPSESLEDLIDAFQTAKRMRCHLVVLRANPQAEEAAIELLFMHCGKTDELSGIAFTPYMTSVGMETAEGHGQTLVAGSGSMTRRIPRGNCMVIHPDETLDATNSIVSLTDRRILAATMGI